MSEHVSYLDLAGGAVRIDFPWAGILAQARERMVLCPDPPGETRGRIELIPDHAVQGIPGVRGLERGVCGFREQAVDGRQRIVLRMFDRFNFVLLAEPGRVAVHMPPDAPASRVLDDVLPLALVPLLEERGGLMLHGAAVARRGRAAALLGVSGSGKSSTAFNLLRFGFRCCADDWVPVVPGEGGALGIRPVTRSLSLRPLSFSLLRDHGVSLETVRQVEDRYYGPAHRPGTGAGQGVLSLLCFVEAHGEPETVPERITAREARRLLEEEKRHFPLGLRASGPGYAGLLADRVPGFVRVRLGTDLEAQGRAFLELFSPGSVRAGREPAAAVTAGPAAAGRRHKAGLVGRAFGAPGREPLGDLVPLLGDADLKVFALAHGFFQNLPEARLLPLAAPSVPGEGPETFRAGWLRAQEWAEGCRRLVLRADDELFRWAVSSWLHSAPVLYPFLWRQAARAPQRRRALREAWQRLRAPAEGSREPPGGGGRVHLSDLDGAADGRERLARAARAAPGGRLRVLLWVGGAAGGGDRRRRLLEALRAAGGGARVTVVPVLDHDRPALDRSMAFLRLARAEGLAPVLARRFPLCGLDGRGARDLLGAGSLETGDAGLFPPAGVPCVRRDRPFPACASCGERALGLCRGGFFFRAG